MVPLTLTLKNFLSYGENNAVLDFRDFSVACLSGKNGHGKSALIDAVTWALWGKCRVKNKEEVIRRGAQEARVELEFESEGIQYRILRSIARKKKGSSSSIDLQMLDYGEGIYKPLGQGVGAQSTIEKILKMDYNSFICSSFILQGMADEFTKRTPAERKKVLSKILELDEYEKLTKRAREHAQSSGAALSALESELDRLQEEIAQKESFDKKLEESGAEEEKVSKSIAEFESIYGRLLAEHESVKAKLGMLEKLKAGRAEARARCERLESEFVRLTELIGKDRSVLSREDEILNGFAEYERLAERERELNEKELTKSKLEKELESETALIMREKAGIEQKISNIEAGIEGLKKIVLETDDTIGRESEIETGRGKLHEALSIEKALDQKKQAADEIEGQISELKNRVEQKRVELEAKGRELADRAKEHAARAGREDELRKVINDLKSRLAECAETAKEMEACSLKLKKIGEEVNGLSARREEIEKRKAEDEQKLRILIPDTEDAHCPLCESPLEQEAKSALIEKLRSAVKAFEADLKVIEKRIEGLKSEGKLLADVIRKAESVAGHMPRLSKELGEKEQSLKDALSASQELKETKAALDALKDRLVRKEYAGEYEKERQELERARQGTGYDVKKHDEVRKEIERLRKFETEHEMLKKDRARRSQAVNDIERAQKELEPLASALSEERFAEKNRKRVSEIMAGLSEIGYSESEHRELKASLKSLEQYPGEKENLEKVKLTLNHRENERKKLGERIDEEKLGLRKTEEEIGGTEGIEKLSGEIREKMAAAGDRIATLKKQKDELLMEISRAGSAIERIEGLTSRKKEIAEKIEKITREQIIFQELSKAFGKNGLQALIIEHAVPEIEIEANRILNRLTEGTMALSLEMVKPTQKGGEKETLEIYIGDSSGTRSYETFSGGEAFRIDFALRVAISKFIANRSGAQLRTLVIDEGFGTQDKDGLDHFVQVINSIKDDFDKILAITHVDELKERFPVRIEVTKEPSAGSSFEVLYS